MLRVCLVGLIAAGHSGVPRYAAALTAALDGVVDAFPDLSVRLLSTPAGAARARTSRIEPELVRGPFRTAQAGPRRVLAEQLAARRADGELLHFFDLSGPLLASKRPFVTTVHDAAIRHGYERTRVAHKHALQPWAISHSAATVAVSAFAKQEAIARFGADPARIHVIHSGPGLVAANGHSVPAGTTAPYFLYVGNLSAHKNLPFLVEAFTAADVDARLLLIGRRGERFEEIQAVIDQSPASGRIEIHRDVSDETVDELYRSATALVLPSRYEGFGFTALEAMARGCPVLASDIPALREISGDGAWLLPVDELPAWTSAIRAVLADRAIRATLRDRGTRTAARYSWDTTARELCALFLRVGRAGS